MGDNNKYLVLIRGLSGSGKTTLADLICGDQDSRISVSVDDYFYDEDDNYEFVPSELKKAYLWCRQETEICMEQGFDVVIVHNTFVKAWEVEPYLKLAEKKGYRVIVSSLHDNGFSDAVLSARSDHGVQIHNIRKQRSRWDLSVFNPRSR